MNFLHSPVTLESGFRRTLFARRNARALWLRRLLGWSALALGLLVWLGWPLDANAMRIKEIAAVQGVRSNQLTGFGLVVGLGTAAYLAARGRRSAGVVGP